MGENGQAASDITVPVGKKGLQHVGQQYSKGRDGAG